MLSFFGTDLCEDIATMLSLVSFSALRLAECPEILLSVNKIRLSLSTIPNSMTSQTAPDWQLQIGESGASSRYNFNMELERLVCKQTALAA